MRGEDYFQILMREKTSELVKLYNSISGVKRIGPKTFNTKTKLVTAIITAKMTEGRAIESDPPNNQVEGSVKANKGDIQNIPKKNGTIQGFAKQLLLTDKPYQEILTEIKKKYPDAKTTLGCLRWYAAKMRELGEAAPMRRTVRAG